jgi:hypothetical protein
MPDKWEYPWFAAWDLCFHCVGLSLIYPEFAKKQLVLLSQVWMMHPNGELPAYEWAFGDVNPPVQAWAALRVYENDRRGKDGAGDTAFLERMFHKLLRFHPVGQPQGTGAEHLEGGFLGLDSRNFRPLAQLVATSNSPTGPHGWQCIASTYSMCPELGQRDAVYE